MTELWCKWAGESIHTYHYWLYTTYYIRSSSDDDDDDDGEVRVGVGKIKLAMLPW